MKARLETTTPVRRCRNPPLRNHRIGLRYYAWEQTAQFGLPDREPQARADHSPLFAGRFAIVNEIASGVLQRLVCYSPDTNGQAGSADNNKRRDQEAGQPDAAEVRQSHNENDDNHPILLTSLKVISGALKNALDSQRLRAIHSPLTSAEQSASSMILPR